MQIRRLVQRMAIETDYDEKYLAGIVLFNQQDYFEAHEVWEDLWVERSGLEHRFLQGLIQVAVGLCHFHNGNVRGAIKLYHSSRKYLEPCGSPFMGVDLDGFLTQHHTCHRELLAVRDPSPAITPDEAMLPILTLDPPPQRWPDVAPYLEDDDRGAGS